MQAVITSKSVCLNGSRMSRQNGRGGVDEFAEPKLVDYLIEFIIFH